MTHVTTWLAAVPTIVGLGLALGMNPVLYGATADTLARGRSVRSGLAALLAGVMTGATVLVLVVHGLNPANLVSRVQHRADAVVEDRAVDLVVGVIVLVAAGAIAVWTRLAPAPASDPTARDGAVGASGPTPHPAPDSPKYSKATSLFVLGATSSVVGFTTLPIAYLVGRAVESVSSDPVFRLLVYAVFLVSLIAPFILLAWVWSRFPAATRKVTATYDRMLAWDSRLVAVVIMVIVGLILLALALFGHH